MPRNIITLARWLITKGIKTPLQVQKLLFFLRYEELQKGDLNGSYFAPNYNFQAWIYGPANPQSYAYLEQYFFNANNPSAAILIKASQIAEIEARYGADFQKWSQYSGEQLIAIAQQNRAWIKARANLSSQQIGQTWIDETTAAFLTF